MSERKAKATRDGYGEGLLKLGEKNDRVIVMDADLAGATNRSTSAALPD